MAVQRLQLVVSDSGADSAPEFVYNPNCCGWEISIRTTAGAQILPQLTITARDKFEDGPAEQTFGPFLATSGGKLYVPFSTFSITAADEFAQNVGNSATVNIVARSIDFGEACQTKTETIGIENFDDITAGGNVLSNTPESAIAYKVTFAGVASGYTVLQRWASGGVGRDILQYSVDPTTTSGPDDGGQRWRELTGTPTTLRITNNDGANAGKATVFYLYDFAHPI